MEQEIIKGGKCKDKSVTLSHPAAINSIYKKQELKTDLQEAFSSKKPLNHDASAAVLHNEPFQCCSMPNFLQDQRFLEMLKEELLNEVFHEKNNDLYKFKQTDDLKKGTTPHVQELRNLLREDLKDWLQEVTGISLNSRVDISCSRYDYTDVLLCHDDELDTRRIAFILYLVPPWSEEDGGRLDLFDMDAHKQPGTVVKSLTPQWNSLVWFEVTEASFHQVSEVLSPDKTRLSVNGWFHGKPVPRSEKYVAPPRHLQPYGTLEDDVLLEWINPIYLDPEVQAEIQEKFEKDSEIELQEFLREEKYQSLLQSLQSEKTTWEPKGPPNKRSYHHSPTQSLPAAVQECLSVLQSEEMFLTLSNLTGLTLHPLAAQNDSSDSETEHSPGTSCSASNGQSGADREAADGASPEKKPRLVSDSKEASKHQEKKLPSCCSEVRRWDRGSYTMLLDTDTDHSDYALDCMLYCGCKDWEQEHGGYTCYITKGEDEELLSVNPSENSLALVYKDPDTLRFVKHVNNKAPRMETGAVFYDIQTSYHE